MKMEKLRNVNPWSEDTSFYRNKLIMLLSQAYFSVWLPEAKASWKPAILGPHTVADSVHSMMMLYIKGSDLTLYIWMLHLDVMIWVHSGKEALITQADLRSTI